MPILYDVHSNCSDGVCCSADPLTHLSIHLPKWLLISQPASSTARMPVCLTTCHPASKPPVCLPASSAIRSLMRRTAYPPSRMTSHPLAHPPFGMPARLQIRHLECQPACPAAILNASPLADQPLPRFFYRISIKFTEFVLMHQLSNFQVIVTLS